jgi:WD40 repeat protein
VSPWQLAPPYLLRHAIQHAAEAGRVDELLLDADFLVHAEPSTLGPELRNAGSAAAQRAAAVYRTSASVHRNLAPPDRRWLLTIDALRYEAGDLAARLTAVGMGDWLPRWATGSKLSKALRDTLVGHSGPVNDVTCATVKGREVAVSAGRDGTVRIWDLSSAEQVGHSLTGHRGPIDSIAAAVLAGGPVAVSGGRDGTVRIWDLTQGEQLGASLTKVTGPVTALACGSIDGRTVVLVGDRDGSVRAWALDDGSPVGPTIRGLAGAVTALACFNAGEHSVVIIGDRGPMVRVCDLADGRQLDRLMIEAGPVAAVRAFPHLGRESAADVYVINGRDCLVEADLKSDCTFFRHWSALPIEHVTAVSKVTVGHDSVVIHGTRHGAVGLNIPKRRKTSVRQLLGHAGEVRGIATTTVEGRPLVVTAADDETVRVWDLIRGVEEKNVAEGHVGTVTAAACIDHGGVSRAVTGGRNGTVLIWDLRTGASLGSSPRPLAASDWWKRPANPLPSKAHVGPVRGIAIGMCNGKPVAVSVGRDRTVRRWELSSVQQIGRSMLGHSGPVNTVSVARFDDTDLAVTGGDDATLLIWDVGTGRRFGSPLTGHSAAVTAVACTVVDGEPLAVSAGRDGTLRLWDLRGSRQITAVAAGHSGTVTGIGTALVGGSVLVVTVGADRTVRRWELPGLRPIGSPMSGHTGPVSAVTVTHRAGDVLLVTGARDRTVRVWHPASGRCVDQLILPSPVQCVTAAADSSLLVCADWELIVIGPAGGQLDGPRPEVWPKAGGPSDARSDRKSGAKSGRKRRSRR